MKKTPLILTVLDAITMCVFAVFMLRSLFTGDYLFALLSAIVFTTWCAMSWLSEILKELKSINKKLGDK